MISAYALAAYAGDSAILLAKASFTTNTRIFYNIDDPQAVPDLANVSSNFGFGAELRVRTFWERWYIGITIEKITGQRTSSALYTSPVSGDLAVPITDGYELMPVEVSAYYSVPISSNTFVFYLGGGAGYYSGKRNYSVVNVASRTTETDGVIGIHVSTGLRWMITPFLGIDGQLRFRDPQINATNVFDQRSTRLDGVTIPLQQGPIHTQINLNGINYSAGLAIVF
jgi:hypothetical protein